MGEYIPPGIYLSPYVRKRRAIFDKKKQGLINPQVVKKFVASMI